MNENVFVQYLKKCLLKVKQNFAHVNDPPKKPSTKDKTEPLDLQRVGPESNMGYHGSNIL
jgi:hypothetical protein